MKYFLINLILGSLLLSGTAQADGSTCQTVSYYRYYNAAKGLHYWSTSPTETGVGTLEGPVGYVATGTNCPGSVPWYRYYNSNTGVHFWSTDPNASAVGKREGVIGHVFSTAGEPGTVPLYRYYDSSRGIHFWSTDPNVKVAGKREGIRAYIFENPSINWTAASAWAGPTAATALPGTGESNSQAAYVIGNKLHQEVWRGGQGWSRTVPIVKGAIQWSSATTWSGPTTYAALPGSGELKTHVSHVVGDRLHQDVWRGSQGWTRTVPIVNGVIQWSSATAWSGPTSITALPGQGELQSLASYMVGNQLHQAIWRGSQGWSRTVPVVNGAIQWSAASAWSGPTTVTALPGSGDIQSQTSWVLGNRLHQTVWRKGQGWYRTVPLGM